MKEQKSVNFDSSITREELRERMGNYFNSKELELYLDRKKIFEKFPILYIQLKEEKIKQSEAELPKPLQKIVDEENSEEIAKYYGVSPECLRRIPHSDTKEVSALTLLAIVKSGLIQTEQLPFLTHQDEWMIAANKSAIYEVIKFCFDLSNELGFKVIDQNDPSTYPDFLKNLIKNTAAKGSASWIKTKEMLTTTHPYTIKNVIDDYINTVFLPSHLKGQENYDVDSVLKEFTPLATAQFLDGVDIGTICSLSNHCHKPQKIRQLKEAKLYSWEPLFTSDLPTYNGLTVTPLASSKELREEANVMNHYIGIYTNDCLYHSTHIISLRDQHQTPLTARSLPSCSTIILKVKKGRGDENDKEVINIKGEKEYHLILDSHIGINDMKPTPYPIAAAEKFFADLRSGKIPVNLAQFETQQQDRTAPKDQVKKAKLLIGYDPNDQDQDENGHTPLQKAISIYRTVGLENEDETKEEKHKKPLLGKELLTRNFDKLTCRIQETQPKTSGVIIREAETLAIFHDKECSIS